MELCWPTCAVCVQKATNIEAESSGIHLVGVNNNNGSSTKTAKASHRSNKLERLGLSSSPSPKRVTFAEAAGSELSHMDCDDHNTKDPEEFGPKTCYSCENKRNRHSTYGMPEDRTLNHKMVKLDIDGLEQFAEQTDSSHVGPPELSQLIADALLPINDVIVNNGIIPDTDNDEVHNLFVDAFLHNNRLEHMIQVMGYHPQYLECFLKTQQYLLRGDGPLPYDYRHYIAIMAAGRHQCSYLIKIQTTEFLLQGGDDRWLQGLDHIPQKLRDLYEVNKILAHRPWLLNKSHIEKLTKGAENWSLSELMHAVSLLAHFHALASFVYGCGVNAEIDQEEGHTYNESSSPDKECVIKDQPKPDHQHDSNSSTPNSSVECEGVGIEELMEKMRKLTEEAAGTEMTQEELQKRFEKVESQSAELPAAMKQPSLTADLLRFIEDPDFNYEDFARRGQASHSPCFRAQDYSWEEQGFSLANRLYTDIGTLLDDKFRTAYDLTYNTMGQHVDVDTSSFRRAIWNYIHSMFGIRHDDYDYNEVNQLMERNLKSYIKTVTCFPERVTKKDYESFMKQFKHSEKVHVNLMLLEAKIQAELLYALRAIMKYMT